MDNTISVNWFWTKFRDRINRVLGSNSELKNLRKTFKQFKKKKSIITIHPLKTILLLPPVSLIHTQHNLFITGQSGTFTSQNTSFAHTHTCTTWLDHLYIVRQWQQHAASISFTWLQMRHDDIILMGKCCFCCKAEKNQVFFSRVPTFALVAVIHSFICRALLNHSHTDKYSEVVLVLASLIYCFSTVCLVYWYDGDVYEWFQQQQKNYEIWRLQKWMIWAYFVCAK